MRLISFFVGCAILFVSCTANADENMQELDLKSQLIGIENANNARQLGGYRIGSKCSNRLMQYTGHLPIISNSVLGLLSR